MAPPRTTSDASRCSAFAVTVTLVLLATVASNLPAAARASAIRSQPAVHDDDGSAAVHLERHRRDVGPPTAVLDVARTAASAVAAANDDAGSVRGKRSLKLLKLKPLILLPAKLALGTGNKLVAGAKLGAKAARVGVKAVGAGLVGLKAVSKVAKVTVKAATALGVKAVLLNFLFHKINQVIDFKTRLLHNLDQKNRQQNAQFLSGVLPASSARPASGSIGNKDNFVPVPPPQQNFDGTVNTQAFAGTIDPTASSAPGSSPTPRFSPGSSPTASFGPGASPTASIATVSNLTPSFAPISAQGFAPASDLIASPPPPSQLQPEGFIPAPPPGVPVNLEPVDIAQRVRYSGPFGYEAPFAASNDGGDDDGSRPSETSF